MVKIAFHNPTNTSISPKASSMNDSSSFTHQVAVKPDGFQAFLPRQTIKRAQIPLAGSLGHSMVRRINLSAHLKKDNVSSDEVKNSAAELTPVQTKNARPIILRKSSRLVLNQGDDSTCGIMACSMFLHTLGKPKDADVLIDFFNDTLDTDIKKEGIEFPYLSLFI
jgi:hypothetical protein